MNLSPFADTHEMQVGAIAERSRDLLFRLADAIKPPDEYTSPHLGQGAILNAIILVEAAMMREREEDIQAAAKHLRHAMALLDEMPLSSSLYRGITGLGWAMQTFPMPELLEGRDETLRDLDRLLADGIEVTRNLNIDIINGVAGIAVYAIARGREQDSSFELWRSLDDVFSRYFSSWSIGDHLPHKSAANNLGVAHGVPGLLAVGAVAHARGLLPENTGALLGSALDLLWTHARLEDGMYTYPTHHGAPARSRLAWCYGALGMAATFRNAIPLDPANAERAVRMIESGIAQYASGAHGIRDATLCHGHAGVALTFEYLAQSDAFEPGLTAALRNAALTASSAALDEERRDLGDCVYFHWTPEGMKSRMSFLEGGPGVALAIAAAYAGAKRPWMNLLAYY